MIYALIGIPLIIVILLLEYYITAGVHNRATLPLYHIKVTLSYGCKIKLVLNEEQYTNFRTWLNKDTDLYEVRQGDVYYMAINRIYLSTVEVKKR